MGKSITKDKINKLMKRVYDASILQDMEAFNQGGKDLVKMGEEDKENEYLQNTLNNVEILAIIGKREERKAMEKYRLIEGV